MPNITSTTQLNTFSLIRDAIRSDSVLAQRFPASSFHEFEPALKGSASLPLWVVKVPGTDLLTSTTDNNTRLKTFTINIMLKMDFVSKDKATGYASRAVAAIEGYESTFNASGYYYPQCSVDSIEDEIEDQKRLVVALMRLELRGAI